MFSACKSKCLSSLEAVSAITKTVGNSVFTGQLREGRVRKKDELDNVFGVDWY